MGLKFDPHLQIMNIRLFHLFSIKGLILHPLRTHSLKEIGGGIPQRVKLAQALYFEGVSIEEFLDDIFKSKRRYSCALL